jgi:serpin B
MAFGMTLNGVGGETFNEMRRALSLPDRPLADLNAGYASLIPLLQGLDPKVQFNIANSIWYRDTFGPSINPKFLSEVRVAFGAEVRGLDFSSPQAVTTINTWVKEKTSNKIDKIIDAIPPDMLMYLMNAIYFKGSWREQFTKAKTAPAAFTTAGGSEVTVDMMSRKGGFRAKQMNGSTVAELPYGGDAWVMTLVLPPANTPIDAFVAALTPATWTALVQDAPEADWDLYLPRFKLEWKDEGLKEKMKSLGMRKAFVPGDADFTPLSNTLGRDLFISSVAQKTFVDVNEEGTVAAAVTSIGIGVVSLPPEVRVNRPFVFAIRERLSGTVAFIGKITNPKQ